MEILAMFGVMLLLIGIGLPIGYAIASSTIFTFVVFSSTSLRIVSQNAFTGIDSFVLMAIPFFILAGILMSAGGVARRLVDIADAFIGWITGGLGMASILTATFFGAISGSGAATTSAVGSLMLPEMKRKKYGDEFSATLIASAGSIGVIIPPSIPFVVYGVTVGVSIGDLFLAGIPAGISMCVALMVACYLISKKKGYRGSDTKPSIKNIAHTLKDGIWALFAPVIILGGIYSGIFTPTESAVVAVVYSLIIGTFVYKELTLVKLKESFYTAAVLNGVIVFIIGFSGAMAKYLALENVPQRVSQGILSLTDNPILILLIINVFLMVVGMLIDNIPAIIILSPIFLPVVQSVGVTPLQFGVIMVLNLAIGYVTPPYGTTLFVASAISKISVDRLSRYAIIFTLVLCVPLALVTYWPWFTNGFVALFK
ncbi:TRAP transporter large permease [Anoxynatronum sibiricum]|uniref:TRAP transporter large permease n=1 Tax=Anoxynatronum sibiricum TaxID=210623 RepID=A0ABU9VW07_9CLOT